MELSLAIHHPLRIIWCHNFPDIILFLDTYAIIGLLWTEIVERGERQRKRILVVVKIKLPHTNQCPVEDNLTIHFVTRTYTISIDHQAHDFRIEFEPHR